MASGTTPFEAFTRKLNVPADVGVPLNSPVVADNNNHAGTLAGSTNEYVIVDGLPVATNTCEYKTPTVPG